MVQDDRCLGKSARQGRNVRDLAVVAPGFEAQLARREMFEAGAKVIDPVEDKDWGDRCGGIEDPFGHVWFVATPRGAPAQRK